MAKAKTTPTATLPDWSKRIVLIRHDDPDPNAEKLGKPVGASLAHLVSVPNQHRLVSPGFNMRRLVVAYPRYDNNRHGTTALEVAEGYCAMSSVYLRPFGVPAAQIPPMDTTLRRLDPKQLPLEEHGLREKMFRLFTEVRVQAGDAVLAVVGSEPHLQAATNDLDRDFGHGAVVVLEAANTPNAWRVVTNSLDWKEQDDLCAALAAQR